MGMKAFPVRPGRAGLLPQTQTASLCTVSSASQKLMNFSQETVVWRGPFILSSLFTSFSVVGELQSPTSEFRMCLRSLSTSVVKAELACDWSCSPSAYQASLQAALNKASSALGRIPARPLLTTRRQQSRHSPLPLVACLSGADHLASGIISPMLQSVLSPNSLSSLMSPDLAFISSFLPCPNKSHRSSLTLP